MSGDTTITPAYQHEGVTLLTGDAREVLSSLLDGSVDCVVTSPPYYGLRDYGTPGQYGLEATPEQYVTHLRDVFHEAKRVLADDGTCWLVLGDRYASNSDGHRRGAGFNTCQPRRRQRTGLTPKNLLGIPWKVAFALQADGWILRNAIIWHKRNALPDPVRDRLARRHELIFLLVKHRDYFFDLDTIREPHQPASLARAHRRRHAIDRSQTGVNTPNTLNPTQACHPGGRNSGDVWTINTSPYPGAHFATFPIELPRRCIRIGCKPGGTVLDPFSGAGTTLLAARELDHPAIGIDLNPDYHRLTIHRLGVREGHHVAHA